MKSSHAQHTINDNWHKQKLYLWKRTHGRGQQCGDCWGKGSIWGLNGNGRKNTIKIKSKKKKIKNGFRMFAMNNSKTTYVAEIHSIIILLVVL